MWGSVGRNITLSSRQPPCTIGAEGGFSIQGGVDQQQLSSARSRFINASVRQRTSAAAPGWQALTIAHCRFRRVAVASGPDFPQSRGVDDADAPPIILSHEPKPRCP